LVKIARYVKYEYIYVLSFHFDIMFDLKNWIYF
jgi:hypothetical protein